MRIVSTHELKFRDPTTENSERKEARGIPIIVSKFGYGQIGIGGSAKISKRDGKRYEVGRPNRPSTDCN